MERRGSLWNALGSARKKKRQQSLAQVGRLRGKNLFRAAVRLVLEYINWINVDPLTEEMELEKTGRKKTQEKQELTIKDRSVLLIKPHERTKENRAYIWQLIKNLRAFKTYEDDLRESLQHVCRYQYVPADRVIVRQGHKAEALYFIVSGEVALSKIEIDEITGDSREINVGTLQPGDIFGEIALLHRVPRSMTIVSKCTVELLYIQRKDFDRILKTALLEEWDILRDAMINFNYFKGWDESMIRECCILSKVKNYQPNEIIIGDGKGMVNYVYFILAGECKLIEHMLVKEKKSNRGIQYKLYNPEFKESISQVQFKKSGRKRETPKDDGKSVDKEWRDERIESVDLKAQKSVSKYTEFLKKKQVPSMDRISIVTATLQDVVTQWHEITEVAALLMKKPSTISQQQYSTGVRTIFMQICIFYRGACFALGEEMRNRRIVSVNQVRCLLIPRYWLLEQNRANIWERVKLFMNSKYPVGDELFQKFAKNRKWAKFKKEFVEDIIQKNGRQIWNDTKKSDVPYSIRINGIPQI